MWANANVSSLQNQITGANTNIQTLNANLGSFQTYANTNFGTSSYSNTNVSAYLSSGFTTSAPQIKLNNATSNYISWGINGVAAPTFTTTSTGTKLLLWPNVSATFTDYAIGIENYNTWFGVPQSNTSYGFKWYGGTTQIARLDGTGNLTVNSNVSAAYFIGDGSKLTNVNYNSTANIIGTASNVTLVAGSYSWTFDNTGNVALPNLANAYINGSYTNGNLIINPQGTGDVYFTPATQVYIQDSSASTSTTTGALVVVGGVGIAGAVNAGNLTTTNGYVTSTASTAYLYNTPNTVYIAGNATVGTYIGNSNGLTQLYGNVQGSTNGFAIGYRDIPQITLNSSTTLALTDAGKHYYATTGSPTLTIPSAANVAFSTGAAITIVNQSSGSITVNTQAGVTLYLAGNATSGANSRVIATYGMATVMSVGTNTWFINGTGVT